MEETKVLGVDQDGTILAAKIDQRSVERMSCLRRPIMSQSSEDTTDSIPNIIFQAMNTVFDVWMSFSFCKIQAVKIRHYLALMR